MKQHELKPQKGSHKQSRRIGRGNGSGRGTYSGHGLKGQKSRSGGGVRRGFSGGQLALMKSLPMLKGFHNPFKVQYAEINLDDLSKFSEGSTVSPEMLKDTGLLKNTRKKVKILGNGSLSIPLNVTAHKFSRTARAAIETAGGTAEEL